MDIAVLIKQVPVSNNVSVDPETHALIRASAEGMINPADLNAIEEAMVLKEQTGGKVVVFTMGPPDAEKALREAMAHGCDESCLITDRVVAGGDTIATARVLAEAIKKYGHFDLILGGALSADGATGQVGAVFHISVRSRVFSTTKRHRIRSKRSRKYTESVFVYAYPFRLLSP
mgnify:CR=1 FL=1